MADIRLKFTINENQANEQITSITTDDNNFTNCSIKDLSQMPIKESGGELLSWAYGELKFNDAGFMTNMDTDKNGVLGSEKHPNMFVWQPTDNNGVKEITINITGTALKDIVIFGNKEANQFITRAYFDGVEVFSDDYKLAYSFPEEREDHEIQIVEWSRPMYNAIITLIRVQFKHLEIDKYSGVKELESLSQSTGQPKEIFYGIVPNSGSANINDIDGELYDMLNDGVLPNSDLPVEVYANGKLIQKHLSVDSDYTVSANARTMSIEFTNVISKWDNIQFEGRPLTWRDDFDHRETAYTLIREVLSNPKLGFVYDGDYNYIDKVVLGELIVVNGQQMTVKKYLEGITIPYAYLPSDTMRNIIDKFCVLAQLNFIQRDNGDYVFVGSRPVAKDILPIVIPTRNQFGSVNTTALLKNKYKAVSISTENAVETIDYLTLVKTEDVVDILGWENHPDNQVEEHTENLYNVGEVNAEIKTYYSTLTFEIDIIDKEKLNKILGMYSGVNDDGNLIKHSVTYDYYEAKDVPYQNGKYSPIYEYISTQSGQIENSYTFDFSYEILSASSTVEVEDKETLSTANYQLSDDGKKFIITLTIRVGVETLGYAYVGGAYGDAIATKKVPKELSVSFYGDKQTISFEDISVDFPQGNSISDKETVKLSGSELLQTKANTMTKVPLTAIDYTISEWSGALRVYVGLKDPNAYVDEIIIHCKYHLYGITQVFTFSVIQGFQAPFSFDIPGSYGATWDSVEPITIESVKGTTLREKPMTEVISENILNDYQNGIMTTTLTISCSDYYDIERNKVKDWAKGDTIQVGDILRIDKDNNGTTLTNKRGEPLYWKVTGRTFRYNGVPLVDLELQECKLL